MSEELQVFNFDDNAVRVVKEDGGELWWIAKDVCDVLEIRTDTVNAILELDEFSNTNTIGVRIDGVNRGLTVVNEPGLYNLIFRSRKPEAKKFKRWITHEVLPSIRQGGGYLTPEKALAILSDPAQMVPVVENLLKLATERQQVIAQQSLLLESKQEQIEAMEPRARYCDEVLSSTSLITTNLIAKELGTAAVTLNRKRQEWGVQYRQGGTWVPYMKYQDQGLGKMTTHTFNRVDGSRGTKSLWKWNEKGRRFIHELFAKRTAVEKAG